MNKYQSYKSSGVEWIGEIPEHWDIKKVKELYLNRNERNIESDNTFLSITKDRGVIPYSEKGNVGNKTSDDIEKYKKVYIDDLVINPMNIIIGSVGLSKYNGVLSGVYMVLISYKNINPKYGSYIFSINSFQKYLKKICYGLMELRESLNKIEFFVEKLPVPKLYEQQQIVQFLDDKTELINKLISTKEKKINLLKEQRTSLINQVVTKGLNPNVKMRDSGVELIGKIPEHWVSVKLKYLTKQIVDGTHFTPTYLESGIPFLRVTDISKFPIDLEQVKFISKEEHEELIKRCNPKKGDLLLSKNGTIGLTRIIDWDWEFSVFVSLCLIKFNEKYLPQLFSYMFQSDIIEQQLVESSKTTSVTNLHLDKIRELFFIKPPISEQNQIVKYLDFKTKEIDDLVQLEQRKIDLLKEYRQSLISEVVTGKIKVTNDE